MLDFGFAELLLIMAVAVLVIGPAEIPALMVGLGRIVRRIQYVRYAFSRQFEDFMRENDLEEIRRQVNFEERDFDEISQDAEYISSSETEIEEADTDPEKAP